MSACEDCWAEAIQRVELFGGARAERYKQVLAEAETLVWPPWHRRQDAGSSGTEQQT